MSKPPSRPRRLHRAPIAALALAGVAGVANVAAPAQASVPPARAELQARVETVRSALADAAAASDKACHAVPNPNPNPGLEAAAWPLGWLVAQATNWTNWPKWSKWSNWANK